MFKLRLTEFEEIPDEAVEISWDDESELRFLTEDVK